MLNYVAMQVVTFCIVYWENPAGSNSVGIINAPTRAGWLPQLFGLDYESCYSVITDSINVYLHEENKTRL